MKQAYLDLLTLFLAEVLGTGFLLFLGCGGCLDIWSDTPTSHFTKCLNFGLVVMVIINIFGCVSGAHLNPAVTLAAVVYKLLPIKVNFTFLI